MSLALLAGCSEASEDGSASTVSEVADTTRVPRIVDDSGRPDVTFDPCLDIPDEALAEAGYDPKSEESADFPMGHYTFLGCGYMGTTTIPGELRRYGLSILSGNVGLEEERIKMGAIASDMTVNGRPALFEFDPKPGKECSITVQTDFGMVIFSRLYHPDHNRTLSKEQRCGGLEETVGLFETFIDDDLGGGAR